MRCLALLPLLLPTAGRAQALDPAVVAAEIEGAKLDLGRAVRVSSVALDAGLATLRLDGILVPASPIAGKPVELVFLGRGRIAVDPPDEIEAGQLELFTGARRLDRTFENAVLVVGQDAAVAALLGRRPANLDDAGQRRASALFRRGEPAASGGCSTSIARSSSTRSASRSSRTTSRSGSTAATSTVCSTRSGQARSNR